MIRKNWLEMCSRAASIAVAFLFTTAVVGIELHAQTAQTVLGGSVIRPVSPPAFLVAPSVALGYSPTSLAAGVLTSSGRVDLVTADATAGKITVFTGQGHGSFARGSTYVAGAQPTSLVVADLDGDGRADVLLANPSEGVISVFSGNGDGTLRTRKTYAVGFTPGFVAVGDFTGNGRQDVAVAAAGGKSLAIVQNDGAGNLQRPVNIGLTGTPAAIVAGDFNHDGHLDLAIANGAGTVSVLLGKGDGQFSTLPDLSVAGGALTSITVGDFNRDGNPDLVVTSASPNQAVVLLGHGDGKFQASAFLAVGNSPVATHVADVDGDGIPDLIVINKGSNTFTVLNGAGDGSFKSAAHFVVGNGPLGVVAADFYGNGRVDLATVNQLGHTLSVPASNGDGTFAAGRAYVAGVQPVAVASGDLTKSGRSDLVVGSYCGADASCGGAGSAAVLLAGPGGAYQLGSTYTMGAGSVAIHVLDVNSDGKLDMIALNRLDKSISVRLGVGDGTFGKLTTIPLSAAPLALSAADFNKDGKVDLAVIGDCGAASCSVPGQVEFLLGSGDGNFHTSYTHTVGYSPAALASGKTSLGGNTDVVIATRCGMDASCKSGGTATVLLGDGAGAFTAGAEVALGNSPSSIALADLKGMGISDLVVARNAENTIAVLPGTGKGSFAAAVPYAVGHAPGALVIADFNGDGQPDVAVANTGDSTVSVLFGKAGGTLQTAFAVPVAGNPSSLEAIATSTGRASLATSSGNVFSPATASTITVVANSIVVHANGVTPNTTTLTATPATTTVNAAFSVTLDVTVTGGPPTPTGTVDITSNGTPATVCTITLNAAGGGSCLTSALQHDVTSLTATYNGDGTYAASTGTIPVVVNAAAPSITLTVAPASPGAVNTNVTFTATLTGAGLTPVTANGTMTFAVGGITIAACTQTVTTAGVAQCQTPDLPLGLSNITATYSGDPNFSPTGTGSTGYTIQKATPTVTVATISGNSTALNTSVAFTATLGGTPFTPTAPGGTVSFSADGTPIGGCTTQGLNGSQVASCSTSALSFGAHSITATYTGDGNFNGNTSAGLPHSITAITPTLAVTSSPGASSGLNAPVTFTATLAGPLTPVPPTGTVSFSAGSTAIVGCTTQAVTLVGGNYQATCVTSSLAAGNNIAIVSTFTPGDTNYNTATSPSLSHTITKLTATVAVTSLPVTTSALNSSVTFTATISGVTFTPVAPTGTVSFSAGAIPISTCTTQAISVSGLSYVASCTTSALNAGNNTSITATYAGDSSFNTATSPGLPHTITPLSGTVSVASSVGPNTTVGTFVTYTATVSATGVSPVAPAGNIAFSLNGTAIPGCTSVTVNASQQAACTTNALVSPTDSITAAYSGDTNFTPVTSGQFVQSVAKASPTVGLTASPSPASVNQSVTFTATVPSPAAGVQTVLPTGSVKFTQGASVLCAAAGLSAANPPAASCAYAFLNPVPAPGTVTATYSGDGNFLQGTAGTTSEVVNTATTTTAITSSGTVTVDQAVTFTTVITPAFKGTSEPQGTVTFTTNAPVAPTGTCISPMTVAANGNVPACTFNFSTAGSYNVSAQFTSSDTNFGGSSSNTVSQTINSGSFGINLTSTPNPSDVNQSVTLSSAFTPPITGVKPTGSVTYLDGNTVICTVTITPSGAIPNCGPTPFVTAGAHSMQTKFAGDGSYNPAGSNVLAQTVNATPLSTAVTSTSVSPSSVNQSISVTARLTPQYSGTALPIGTVSFFKNLNGQITNLCASPSTLTIAGNSITASCSAPIAASGSYTITAQYNTSNQFTSQTDSNFTQGAVTGLPWVVGTSTITQTITPPAAPIYVNQKGLAISVKVKPQFTGTVPTGTVTFSDSVAGTQLCAAQNLTPDSPSDGGASVSCPVEFLSTGPSGLHTVTAVYSGDGNFPTDTQTSSITVLPTTTTLVIQSAGAASVNQPVVFTTTLTPTYTGASIPRGTITFTTTSTLTPSGTCTAGATIANDGTVPSCTFIFPAAGNFQLTGHYAGDANFGSSTSAQVSQSVNASSTGMSISSSLVQSSVNQPVTFSSGFSPKITGTQPQGSVKYVDGATTMCTVSVTSAGLIPDCTYPFAIAGTHAVQANFTPSDTNFSAQTSGVFNQTVTSDPTTAALRSSSANATSAVNESVTFTATITPSYKLPNNAPPGNVSFTSISGGTPTDLCSSVVLAPNADGTGTATCTYIFLTTATYSVTATYAVTPGTGSFIGSVSPAVAQNVVNEQLTVAVAPDLNTTVVNKPLNFSVTITPNPTGKTTPTGNVSFVDTGDNKTLVCQAAPVSGHPANGTSTATCSITFLSHGTHVITATYNGDTNFTTGLGTATAVNVTSSPTTATVSSLPNPSYANQAVTFVAVIAPRDNKGPGLAVPSGSVIFTSMDDATGLIAATCPQTGIALTAQPDGTASAICTVMFPHSIAPVGQVDVTVTTGDSPDGNFTGSSSAAAQQTIQDFNVDLPIVAGSGSVSQSSSRSSEGVIHLTQGYETSGDAKHADPWGAAQITSTITTSSGYVAPSMKVTCSVFANPVDPNKPLSDPSCSPAGTKAVGTTNNSGSQPYIIMASGSAPPGAYTVQITTYDANNSSFTQMRSFPLYVVGPSAQLSLGAGSQGTQTLAFNTSFAGAGDTISTYGCGEIINADTMTIVPNTNLISCSGPTNQAVGGATTLIPITIQTSPTSIARVSGSSFTMYATVVFGVPLLALFGWFGTKRSPRRSLYQFLSLVVVVFGLSYATGCGGSFSRSAPPVSKGIQPGNYLVQVIATGTSGNKYYAVVPLQVASIQ